jgi:chorismate synthase
MSTFGNYYKITTFGESHCNSVGVTITSPPPNINLDIDKIQKQLSRRRPGQSSITTPRDETDKLIVLSGMENGKTLGTPLTIIVNNKNTRPEDYIFTKDTYIPRPSHSDFTYLWKYGIHAASGGGRSSARETIGRVIAGAIADQILEFYNVNIIAYVSQVNSIKLDHVPKDLSRDLVDRTITRCPNDSLSKCMEDLILKLKEEGNSTGGKVTCVIKNCPRGLGEPVFDKTEALLAQAMMSIPATKGFEIGSGFSCIEQTGSQHNDKWINNQGSIGTETNNNGGIIGGITNGENIHFSVAFKPPATISMDQNTVNLKGEDVVLQAKGRHDPCVVPRAVPIVEAMASIVILDLLLAQIARKNIGLAQQSHFNV